MSSQEHECEPPGPAGRTRIVNYGSGFVSDVAEPVDVHVDTTVGLFAELRSLGRTEDAAVTPNGQRIALAGFSHQVIGLLDIHVNVNVNGSGSRASTRTIGIGSITRLCSELLISPHGVSFVDDEVLLVANRAGALVALRLPAPGEGGDVAVESWVVADRSATVPLWQPGSVTVRRAGGGLHEAVVCDNDAHRVVRYVLDANRDLAVVDSEVLVEGLSIPDGAAVSASGEWLAVSNHEKHEVCIYRYGTSLRPGTQQVGALSGVNFPHGLSFLEGDRHVVVADAGLPFVYVYTAPDGDWSGIRSPAHVARVMSDDVFNSGHYNPSEGGPKGLSVIPGASMVAVTSEWQSLACFSVADLLGSDGGLAMASSSVSETDVTTRRIVLRASERLSEAEQALAGSRTEHHWLGQALAHSHAKSQVRFDDLAACLLELEASRSDLVIARGHAAISSTVAVDLARQVTLFQTSWSWRLTAPLRRLGSAARVFRRRP